MKSLPCVINNQVLNLDQHTISTGTFKYKPDICMSMPICTSTEQCKTQNLILRLVSHQSLHNLMFFNTLSVTFCSLTIR